MIVDAPPDIRPLTSLAHAKRYVRDHRAEWTEPPDGWSGAAIRFVHRPRPASSQIGRIKYPERLHVTESFALPHNAVGPDMGNQGFCRYPVAGQTSMASPYASLMQYGCAH